MHLSTAVIALLALVASVAEALPPCQKLFVIPFVVVGQAPVTEQYLKAEGQVAAKGFNPNTKEIFDLAADEKSIFLETKQFGAAGKAVFVKSDFKARMVHCERAELGKAIVGRTPDGKPCDRLILPFVKKYCTDAGAAAVGRIVAGGGKVVKFSQILVDTESSAAATQIRAKVTGNLNVQSTVKAALDRKIDLCLKKFKFGFQRQRCISLAKSQARASSTVNIDAKGGKIDAKVDQVSSVDKDKSFSGTKISLKSKTIG